MRVSRVGAHAFRHAFITECARAGVPEGAIRDWVGHSSLQITRIYQHWAGKDSDARILAALPAAIMGVEALPGPDDAVRQEIGKLLPAASGESLRAALAALKNCKTA